MEVYPFIKTNYEEACSLYKVQKYTETIEKLDKLIKEYPLICSDFYTLRANCFQNIGKTMEAYKDFIKALELNDCDNNKKNYIYSVLALDKAELHHSCLKYVLVWVKSNEYFTTGWLFYIHYLSRFTNIANMHHYRKIIYCLKKYIYAFSRNTHDIQTNKDFITYCNTVLQLSKRNLEYYAETHYEYLLRAISCQLDREICIKNGFYPLTNTHFRNTQWNNPQFIEKFTQRCIELKHDDVPLYAFLHGTIFPSKEESITVQRVNSLENASILQKIYKKIKPNITLYNNTQHFQQTCHYPYILHNMSNVLLFKELNDVYIHFAPELEFIAPHINKQTGLRKDPLCDYITTDTNVSMRKLKVGFISNDFHTTNVLKNIIGIITGLHIHYTNSIDIHCYTYPSQYSTSYISSLQVKTLDGTLSQVQNTLANEDLDVLIFGSIYTGDMCSYYLSFGRYAPVQCCYWANKDTTGQQHIDYFISSSVFECDNMITHNNYCEKVIYLKNTGMYSVNPLNNTQFLYKTREDYGFTEEHHIYMCLQHLSKIQPWFDVVVLEILSKDPYAVIVCMDVSGIRKELIHSRWKETIGSHLLERIHFIEEKSYPEYMNIVNIADVILDTYPVGACYSAIEAFVLGKIVITLPSQMLRGRFVQGFYSLMGKEFDTCIASNQSDYISKALYYGCHSLERNMIGKSLMKNVHVLIENDKCVHEWAETLIQIADRSQN